MLCGMNDLRTRGWTGGDVSVRESGFDTEVFERFNLSLYTATDNEFYRIEDMLNTEKFM